MLQIRFFPLALGLLASLFVVFLLYTPHFHELKAYPSQVISSFSSSQSSSSSSTSSSSNDKQQADAGNDGAESPINNATLGFQKIFAVGLPERSDKRDALALISSLTGFQIDWIDGMRGESVPDKALPAGVNRTRLWESNLGSWRGHMNAIRTMVEQNIQTALIMEDDMDWDVRLKSQLLSIAQGTKHLQATTFNPDPHARPSAAEAASPYGPAWDILWLGHCGEVFPEVLDEYKNMDHASKEYESISAKWTIHPDDTVPPVKHTAGFQNYTANPHTRWVHISGGPICTFAYALTLSGARKVLFDLSVDHLVGPFDNALMGLCRWGRGSDRLGMRCYTVTPPVFMHHRAKGSVAGDSDIQKAGGKGEERKVGSSENLVWSARLNIRELLMGWEMKSQWKEEEDVLVG